MIILGINEDHNATAALIKDGSVLACISEERISRIKNDIEYPRKAIDMVMDISGIKPWQIDYVAFAGVYCDAIQMRIKRTTKFKICDYIAEMNEYWKKVLLENKSSDYTEKILRDKRFVGQNDNYYDYSFMQNTSDKKWPEMMNEARIKTVESHLGIKKERIRFVDHHTSHAFYAYFASPRNHTSKAVVVTADGWGDGCNATISILENCSIKEIHRTAMANMARIYRWTTLLLGMKPNEHEYKVMGLAPYAKSYILKQAYEIYKDTLVVDGLDFKWKVKPSDMYFYFRDKFEGIRFDGIAGGIQLWLEELLSQWITNIMRHTEAQTLYYSGGLAMNVKANKVIAELPIVKDIYIAPSGGDESLAIGAAFFLLHGLGEMPVCLHDAYLGNAPSKDESQEAIRELLKGDDFKIIDEPVLDEIADLLSQGKVLGRCVGRMEFGARSLGNRAILCDPSKYENLRIINEKVKFRDFWMPFTPSILAERAKDYIVNPKELQAEYMTLAFDSTSLARDHLKAAIHPYDFTVRPQLVTSEINHEYYCLIKAFEKKTGVGGILNTSLNLHGQPIASSAKDALEVLIKSGLDGLILPGILIMKKQ